MLQWAREHDCPWAETTCEEAAAGGHVAVLQWAIEQGCPWDVDATCEMALAGYETHHRETQRWLADEGFLQGLQYSSDDGSYEDHDDEFYDDDDDGDSNHH